MERELLITKILVLLVSIILDLLIIVLFFMNKAAWDSTKLVACIVVSFWAFFIVPTIKYILNWFASLSATEAFYAGFRIGYHGIGVLLVMAPVIGIMYYLDKKLTRKDNSKMIMVGWYIS